MDTHQGSTRESGLADLAGASGRDNSMFHSAMPVAACPELSMNLLRMVQAK